MRRPPLAASAGLAIFLLLATFLWLQLRFASTKGDLRNVEAELGEARARLEAMEGRLDAAEVDLTTTLAEHDAALRRLEDAEQETAERLKSTTHLKGVEATIASNLKRWGTSPKSAPEAVAAWQRWISRPSASAGLSQEQEMLLSFKTASREHGTSEAQKLASSLGHWPDAALAIAAGLLERSSVKQEEVELAADLTEQAVAILASKGADDALQNARFLRGRARMILSLRFGSGSSGALEDLDSIARSEPDSRRGFDAYRWAVSLYGAGDKPPAEVAAFACAPTRMLDQPHRRNVCARHKWRAAIEADRQRELDQGRRLACEAVKTIAPYSYRADDARRAQVQRFLDRVKERCAKGR